MRFRTVPQPWESQPPGNPTGFQRFSKAVWPFLAVLLLCAMLILDGVPMRAQEEPGPRTVRVGYFGYDGFIQRDPDGGYSGYGYEYLEQIAARTGWEYSFVFGTWEECVQRLADGEVDLVGAVQYSPERRQQFEFSRYSAGVEYAALYVTGDNDRIYYDDYEAFDGMRIGMISGNHQNGTLEQYAKDQGFTYEGVQYGSVKALKEALTQGEVDAVMTGSLRATTGEKVVAKFAPEPFYFVAAKGNRALMDPLNGAMEEIQTTDVNFHTELYSKYYGKSSSNQLAFTRDEAAFISGHPTLRVAYNRDWSPVEYQNKETGVFSGAAAGVMELISRKSGIDFAYLPAKNEQEAIAMLREGKADLLCGYPQDDQQDAKGEKILLTRPYLEMPLTISKPGWLTMEQIGRIAVPANCQFLERIASHQFPDAKMLRYPDTEACMEAVLKNEADAVFENLYVLDQFSKDERYTDLDPVLSVSVTSQLCMGVPVEQDLLLTLLNKVIAQISSKEVNHFLVENTMVGPHVNPRAFVRRYAPPVLAAFVLLILFMVYRSKRKVERYAFTDPLTGGDNQVKFGLSAEKLLQDRGFYGYAVVSLDIDKFKLLNNMHSFETGNQVLRAISGLLSAEMEPHELFCRFSSDHFILLLKAGEGLEKRLQGIIQRIAAVPHAMGIDFQYFVSCGVYLFSRTDSDLHGAIGWASLARKGAKNIHQNKILYYDESMRKQATREQEIENRMEAALKNREFTVYYQPKFRLTDGAIVGAEALVRWIPQSGEPVYPGDFIPVFENNGFIIQLDLYVFEQVCRQLRAWLDMGKTPCPVSINLSRVHLSQPEFHQHYLQILEESKVPSGLIEIELTESTMFENKEQMISVMSSLKVAGLAVSMDDFGTGYSSLNLLKDLPIDYLKLDREFFNESADTKRGKTVIESVVYMAHRMGITVVAEGVETLEQVQFLSSINCDIVQGYYYARPLTPALFEERLFAGGNVPQAERA